MPWHFAVSEQADKLAIDWRLQDKFHDIQKYISRFTLAIHVAAKKPHDRPREMPSDKLVAQCAPT
jgi:hypothetical protein